MPKENAFAGLAIDFEVLEKNCGKKLKNFMKAPH
jgi:hypothetical protein